ncbi:protein of HAD-superfamily phosphatase, subfamily IIIA [Pseudohyphozyma bogoriensis]|nr:protein of HAD-superfamily phosphatase, subfamily IIIA [Pseudohyphozyma bogoriensis]
MQTDITQLNFTAFRKAGITGVVLDKDNCLTKPSSDALEPRLKHSWKDLVEVFGAENVLVVSNSAGTGKDSLLLQAESVSRNLRVPVLVHSAPKPSPKAARSVVAYFSPPPAPPPSSFLVRTIRRLVRGKRRRKEEPGMVVWPRFGEADKTRTRAMSGEPIKLLVIGDRLTTDVVLAHRIAQLDLPIHSPTSTSSSTTTAASNIETVSVLTTALHEREGLGTTLMRSIESAVTRRRLLAKADALEKSGEKGEPLGFDWSTCLVPPPPVDTTPRQLTLQEHFLPRNLLNSTLVILKATPDFLKKVSRVLFPTIHSFLNPPAERPPPAALLVPPPQPPKTWGEWSKDVGVWAGRKTLVGVKIVGKRLEPLRKRGVVMGEEMVKRLRYELLKIRLFEGREPGR